MRLSPGRSWLVGATLSGLLLTVSILGPAYSQRKITQPIANPFTLVSDYTPTNTAHFLNQKLNLNPIPPAKTPPIVSKHIQTENAQVVTNSSGSNLQPVVIAQVSSREALPKTYQISRGSSPSLTIAEHALSLLGTPYVFGGTTLKGFDCSGFTQYIFAWSGISLPRTSYAQFDSGSAINQNELQPGDLVFFETYSKGASHVGIYIGGGNFIHADNPRVGVTITSLSNSFYSAHYLGARRYN